MFITRCNDVKNSSSRNGFSLVEVVLSVALFALFVSVFVGAVVYGQESAVLAGERGRAILLVEEGLEVTQNVRDENFANLVDGNYGLAVVNNQWVFSGANDVNGIFTRQITIASVATDRKQVTATVTWQQTPQRSGTVTAVTRLTNWRPI